jgi:hypothetical protein
MANYIGNQIQRGEFKKLDNVSSLFDGSTTTFNLTFNSTPVQVGDTTALIVSLNGVIQEPVTSYTLANGGSQIVFSTAPSNGASCFITQLGGIGDTTTPSDGSVIASKIANGAVTDAKIDTVSASKLTGTIDGARLPDPLPAIDGSSLTGIDALPSQSGQSGNYLTTDGSTASWAALDTDANSTTKGLYEHSATISANYSITSGNNAMTAGPITIDDGVSVTIPDGSVWTIV